MRETESRKKCITSRNAAVKHTAYHPLFYCTTGIKKTQPLLKLVNQRLAYRPSVYGWAFFALKKAGRKPLQLLSSVQNTLCIEYGKVRFIFCERVKRRPHRQRSSSVSIIIAARGREKLRIVGIIVIAGTQPDYTRLTALLYIVTQA